MVGEGTYVVADKNVAPVKASTPPRDKPGLRRFLGLTMMSRQHIPQYAQLSRPLTRLTGNVPWRWGNEEQQAFEDLRAAVTEASKLYIADYDVPFCLDTDASDDGMGAVLYQVKDGKVHVIRYLSKAFSSAMVTRPIYYKEARAIIWRTRICMSGSVRSYSCAQSIHICKFKRVLVPAAIAILT